MKKRLKQVFICICIVGAVFVFMIWQNNDIVVTRYTYHSEKISDALIGYKIIQISDLHNKQFGKKQKRLLAQIAKEEPDMIVVTGDLVDSDHADLDKAMCFMEDAVELAPVYYVTGNHEYWLSSIEREALWNRLKQCGVIRLENQLTEITVSDDSYVLIGLEDNSLTDSTLQMLLKEYEEQSGHNEYGEREEYATPKVQGQLQILLAHEPQYLESYAKSGVDVVLSGHAHGGQIRFPGLGGLVAPNQGFFPEYTAGLYKEGSTHMYVSRGLGNSVIPLRIFNRPEIVVLELELWGTL